ncbi:hypothetical protein KEP95_17295, partial [Escherichia coli]|nr:hypothetical protein [Escherichia coli]
GYKCRVRSCRQQPAGKSMSRMVRITAANTSTFYCCIPSRSQIVVVKSDGKALLSMLVLRYPYRMR